MIVDFGKCADPWLSIDDVVMGGVSHSEMVVEDGVAAFQGTLSLDNGGGFASVRSRPSVFPLAGLDGLLLRVKGDGNRYRLRLRTTDASDGVSYEAVLEPFADGWEDLAVPFTSFRPVFRGRTVEGFPPLDPAAVRTLGLMISDRQEGPFRLELASIDGWRATPG